MDAMKDICALDALGATDRERAACLSACQSAPWPLTAATIQQWRSAKKGIPAAWWAALGEALGWFDVAAASAAHEQRVQQ